jgi:CxxC motif-containing protein
MEKRELICIGCPLGCMLYVEHENGEISLITGHTCPRGEEYARKEVINPTRILTSTVKVSNGIWPMVSVKTDRDIPKYKIMECIIALKGITILAPVSIGDVILNNVADTGCNIIATKNVEKTSN